MKRKNETKIKNMEDKIAELKHQLKNTEKQLKEEKSNMVQPWEEEIIHLCVKNGLSVRSIGSLLERAPSTIANYSKPRIETSRDLEMKQMFGEPDGDMDDIDTGNPDTAYRLSFMTPSGLTEVPRTTPRTNGVKKNLVDKVDHRGVHWYFVENGCLMWHNKEGRDKLVADNWEELAGLEPNALFETLIGRPCNWKDAFEKMIYNQLYKLLRPTAGRGKKRKKGSRRKDQYGNDVVRANVMRKRHNTKGHLTPKRKAEHDRLKECPVCYPETSRYAKMHRGHDLYIKKIQKQNMEAIDFAVNKRVEKVVEKSTVKTGLRQIDDKDYHDMSQQDLRYVNKLENKIKAMQTESENIKKKNRGKN